MEKQWSLESITTNGDHVDFMISKLPFRIGRGKDNDLVIGNLGLSRNHAAFALDISGHLRLIDEDSTNGSFVNRERVVGYCLLEENDIIHFAGAEFKLRLRLIDQTNADPFEDTHTFITSGLLLTENFVEKEVEFDELLRGHGISGAAQPIVDAHTRQIVGYELLGRANHPSLPNSPIELFRLAKAMGRELDLSLAFRDFGLNNIAPRYVGYMVFINAHATETFNEGFFSSLASLRKVLPRLNIVVEIHESTVTDADQLCAFAKRLAQMGIRFAYDDFGAGQARLLELADTPPHFVKFDMALIRNLHKASERKRQLVRDLVKMVLAAGSVPLAEGVESEQEAEACIEMGFKLIQGYLTGRPILAEHP